MTPLWTAIALMATGFAAMVTGLVASVLIVAWWDRWQEARYVPSAEEAAWEAHVATTPGLADAAIEACDLAMWEMEGNYPQVYDAEDFGGPAS